MTTPNPGWTDEDEDGLGRACDNEVEVDPPVPALVSGSGSAEVAWRSNGGENYSVRVAGNDCASGNVIASGPYTATTEGRTRIDVRLLDEGNNVLRVCISGADGDTSSATATVTKDSQAPSLSPPDLQPASDSGVSQTDNITNVARPTFSGTAEPESTVVLVRDGLAVAEVSADEAGNWSLTDRGETLEGSVLYSSRAVDGAENSAASSVLTVTFDRASPDTRITAGPEDGSTTADASATFKFNSTEDGSAFSCSLDGAVATACNSPRTVSNLAPGQHTFAVSASDAAGNFDGVPATRRWTITAAVPERSGYWMLGSTGSVYGFGEAAHLGAPVGIAAANIAQTPSGNGYWIVSQAGDVYAYGDATVLGGPPALRTGELVSSLSPTPTGSGYWLFTNRGRALPYGTAAFFGDVGDVRLDGPVLGSVSTPSGNGYYMVASDGGIFAFGDAGFAGSMGGQRLDGPVVGLAPDPDGVGYWLVASDGGIFAFSAGFRGSMGGRTLNQPMVGMVAYGDGYLMVASDGGIFNFSTRPFRGSLGNSPPPNPIIAVAPLK